MSTRGHQEYRGVAQRLRNDFSINFPRMLKFYSLAVYGRMCINSVEVSHILWYTIIDNSATSRSVSSPRVTRPLPRTQIYDSPISDCLFLIFFKKIIKSQKLCGYYIVQTVINNYFLSIVNIFELKRYLRHEQLRSRMYYRQAALRDYNYRYI